MLLCLDIGNSHIFGGVFKDNELLLCFRHPTYKNITSDQLGTFLKTVLQENQFDASRITMIALCSVVPSIDYSLKAACIKYFKIDPFVLVPTETKTNIEIKTINPKENGADIIASVIAASNLYPQENIILIDFGTVTTMAAITKNSEYLGVTFIPGISTAMNSLQISAANLFQVEIIKPKSSLGKSTAESIQSGIFFGHLGSIKEIVLRITEEIFQKKPLLIATGGFAHLFKEEKIFDHLEPYLVLQGIKTSYELNKK